MNRKKTLRRSPHVKAVDPDRLTHLRAEILGLSQVELAHKAGIDVGAVSKVERGRNIARRLAEPMAEVLGEPFSQLFVSAGTVAVRQLGSPRKTVVRVEVRQASDAVADPVPSAAGFTLVADGFIGSMAGELILEDDRTAAIRSGCPLLYESCLRDLTFGLVYGSFIVTSGDFRPSLTQPNQPGKELFNRIGEIWKPLQMDDDLISGSLLSQKRPEITADLRHLGKCITNPRTRPFFKEYMVREAQKHLGTHASLFERGLSPDRYKFDTKRDYYYDLDLQSALGNEAADTLMSFLPERKGKEPYAREGLTQFATRNALSLITIMWEYDLSAQRRRMWRLPHILRSLVKQESHDPSLTHRQEELRELVVRNALLPALQNTEKGKKYLIVNRLMDLRDHRESKQIREALEHENLLFLEPSQATEKRAQKVLRHIKGLSGGSSDTDLFLLRRRSALRKLDTVPAGEFEQELHRVFPELNSATKKYVAGQSV
jgi:transcriptional regulator with XRE-family HTH domain